MKTCHDKDPETANRDSYSLPRFRVSLIRETSPSVPPRTLASSADAGRLLAPCFEGLDREQFVICGIDAKHRIIGCNIVSIGSLTLAIVHPREVYKPLILMNAAAFICAHNHPSGDPAPSTEDRELTARLRKAGELLGISMLDHIILGHDRNYSFADYGWPGCVA